MFQPGHNPFVLNWCLFVFALLKYKVITLKTKKMHHLLSASKKTLHTLKYCVPFSLTMQLCSSFSTVFISHDSLAWRQNSSVLRGGNNTVQKLAPLSWDVFTNQCRNLFTFSKAVSLILYCSDAPPGMLYFKLPAFPKPYLQIKQIYNIYYLA